jgi:ankyrin repeat domain-containing protein 50
MSIALATDESSRSLEDLDLEREDRFRATVRNLCGLFVTVIDSKICLVHQTAEEFLVSNGDIWPSSPGIWKHLLEPNESNLVIAKVCITYLLFTVFKRHPLAIASWKINQSVDRYINSHDFLNYSTKHWATHCREAKTKQTAILPLTLELCNTQSKEIFLTWF